MFHLMVIYLRASCKIFTLSLSASLTSSLTLTSISDLPAVLEIRVCEILTTTEDYWVM